MKEYVHSEKFMDVSYMQVSDKDGSKSRSNTIKAKAKSWKSEFGGSILVSPARLSYSLSNWTLTLKCTRSVWFLCWVLQERSQEDCWHPGNFRQCDVEEFQKVIKVAQKTVVTPQVSRKVHMIQTITRSKVQNMPMSDLEQTAAQSPSAVMLTSTDAAQSPSTMLQTSSRQQTSLRERKREKLHTAFSRRCSHEPQRKVKALEESLVIQKAQRTVDVPLLQYIDTTVDVPVFRKSTKTA